ncbi:MmgE/PrpD family protein [Acidisphaera sp. L21]|uniref:MmgE/PrpD family protein n=1 Tax=Acidisphaera sp. L21 TaxID=1641851 RepID=UPI00131AC71E|nr:MmgE/PrpD family protein [Acidisphaera sp. L21]
MSAATAAHRFARHALAARYEDLSADAVAQAKVFILDTFGVGIAGSTAYGADELMAASSAWGAGEEATVWGRRERVPAPTGAMLNAFQVHCQEYDSVHEGAVLHPLATTLSAATAYAERKGGISGKDLLVAAVIGVDIASGLGIASESAMRFFRPATAGGFGAVGAVGRLMGMTETELVGAFGVQYAQTSGTLQPHVEGSVTLPLQVGVNARAALQSADLTRAGVVGPTDTFEGKYGYMHLFEGQWDLEPVLQSLGKSWRIAEMSHKPYPSGRATHAGVEGIIELRRRHGFTVEDVGSITIVGPPVTARLCSRPDIPNPSPNYARLCMSYVAAKVLLNGVIDLAHYRGAELTDPATHALASRIRMLSDDSTDPNALLPVDVTIVLTSGQTLSWHCDAMLASPTRRLTRDQHLTKFHRCCDFAQTPMSMRQQDALIDAVDTIETIADIRTLTRLLRVAA